MFAFDANPNIYYTFIAQLDKTVSPVAARLFRPGAKPDIIDLVLQPGIHDRTVTSLPGPIIPRWAAASSPSA